MAKKEQIVFEAYLKSSTSTARPIKIGVDGEADILLETEGSELAEVMRLLTLVGTTFRVTIEEAGIGDTDP